MSTLTDARQLKNVVKKSPTAIDKAIVIFNGTLMPLVIYILQQLHYPQLQHPLLLYLVF
jgi:hypothetical protein